ncbi:hypothetical protein HaLaN_13733 [Haematococcus lacustris]|uniref:Uncharacterized protein n=1 Tax=Haematococcus lacustris TaxID=44745 RepID=A0A699Z3I6_HAELA|nr:hypothetical protein HaLaN_13733 [Haematococcus lacustris]
MQDYDSFPVVASEMHVRGMTKSADTKHIRYFCSAERCQPAAAARQGWVPKPGFMDGRRRPGASQQRSLLPPLPAD